MLDGLSDAVELVGDLLDGRSGLNSGNSPSAGPTGAGTGTATPTTYDSGDPAEPESRRQRRQRERQERQERLRERRPELEQARDIANDMHDQMRDDNINEVVDVVQDVLDTDGEGPRRRRRLRDIFKNRLSTRTRPRYPGTGLEQALSPQGAESSGKFIEGMRFSRARDNSFGEDGLMDLNRLHENRQEAMRESYRNPTDD